MTALLHRPPSVAASFLSLLALAMRGFVCGKRDEDLALSRGGGHSVLTPLSASGSV